MIDTNVVSITDQVTGEDIFFPSMEAAWVYQQQQRESKAKIKKRAEQKARARELNPDEWVEPEAFVKRMEYHWIHELKNVSSEALRKTWRQIAGVFMSHIMEHYSPNGKKTWRILNPPCGSGKTEGAIIYCAMLSELEYYDHPGVLIVTRLIEDCDRIANRINLFSQDKKTAIAYHSEVKAEVSLNDLKTFPCLIITHRAYELALDYLGHEQGTIEGTWDYFHDYGIGQRKMIVVDEALDIVEHSKAGLNGLRYTAGSIPQHIRKKHPVAVEAIEAVIKILDAHDRKEYGQDEMHFLENTKLPKDLSKVNEDLSGLIKELDRITFYWSKNDEDLQVDSARRESHREKLKDLMYIFTSWAYYAKSGDKHSINTARLLVPEGVKGAVVMDATARTNKISRYHKDSFLLDSIEGARDYQNFTLNVSKGHRVGKAYMTRKTDTKQLCSDLVRNLDHLQNKKVFVVCHKDAETILNKVIPSTWTTGHWGGLDGSNEWRNCEAVVIFGFPYLPDTWTPNVYMALQGKQTNKWLSDEGKEDRFILKRGQLSTNIIQAINRIIVRKVIDSQGNCPQCEGYILLPGDQYGEPVLEDIIDAMPGLKVKPWIYQEQLKKVRGSNHKRALIKFIENMPKGKALRITIQKTIGMSPRTFERLIGETKDSESDLSKAMRQAHVIYNVRREGKTQKAYLEKLV